MYKLVDSGVRIPTPLMFYEGVLLMDLVRGEDGHPAPRMIDVAIEREAAVGIYADLVAQIMPTYYRDRAEDLVIDKCRAWGTPGNLRMLRTYVTAEPRIVVLTRPVVEVLASFISLIHRNPPGSVLDQRLPASYRPIDDVRCDALMASGGDIDRALWTIHELAKPENAGVGHLLAYADLVADPAGSLAAIEVFLGLAPFAYDLEHVVNPEPEDDGVYGLAGMHEVRPRIERRSTPPEEVLSEYVLRKYAGL
jgi:hypothetical protein